MTSPAALRRSSLLSFVEGARLVFRGFGLWSRSPRLMLLGAIPALIVGVLYLALLVALLLWTDTVATWLTPFAADWAQPARVAVRLAVGLAVVVLAVFLLIRTYAALALAVGDPFYERIWHDAEVRLGDAPPEEAAGGFWTSVRRGLSGFLRLTGLSLALGLLIFVIGLVPLIGTIVAAVLGAVTGGHLLALELTGWAGDARGMSLGDRRRMLRRHDRAKALGFGVTTYLLFLVPVLSVIAMPAAVVGATMLVREATGENTRLPDAA